MHIREIPLEPSLLKAERPQPSSFSSSERCANSSIIFVAFCWTCCSMSLVFFVLGSPELDPAGFTNTEWRGRIASFGFLVTLFLMQSGTLLDTFAGSWYNSSKRIQVFLCRAVFQMAGLHCVLMPEVIPFWGRTLHFISIFMTVCLLLQPAEVALNGRTPSEPGSLISLQSALLSIYVAWTSSVYIWGCYGRQHLKSR